MKIFEVTQHNQFYGKIFYHGTNSEFDDFDSSLIGRTDSGFIGTGFYLTGNKKLAQMYAQGAAEEHGGNAVVLSFKVFPRKTLEIQGTGVGEWNEALKSVDINPSQDTKAQTQELKNLGYDSVAAWRGGQVKEFVVFDTQIIKRVRA